MPPPKAIGREHNVSGRPSGSLLTPTSRDAISLQLYWRYFSDASLSTNVHHMSGYF